MVQTDLAPAIFYGGLLAFLLAAVGTLWFRMGAVLNRLGRVEAASEATQKSVTEQAHASQTLLNTRQE